MSRINFIFKKIIFPLFIITFPNFVFACDLNSRSFPKNIDLIPECKFSIKKAGSSYRYENGYLTVRHRGVIFERIEAFPPSAFSVSPDGLTFYLNDGKGSELNSFIEVYNIHKGKVVVMDSFKENLIKKFKTHHHCKEQPNLWGIGFSNNSKEIYVLVQSMTHSKCLPYAYFHVARVSIETGNVIKIYDKAESVKKYSSFLPENLRE